MDIVDYIKAVKKNYIRRDRYDKLKQEKADLRKDLRTKSFWLKKY